MPRGKFIVIEGLDGSGISTQTEYLRTWCQRQGFRVTVTKEPTDGPTGGVIKWVLRRDIQTMPEDALALLFAADRSYHLATEVDPALKEGTTVISDRYVLSSFAYQLVDVPDLTWLRSINARARDPDLTLFLDVPPEDCVERMTSDAWRGLDKLQRYETLPMLRKVRDNFMNVIKVLQSEGQHIVIVDGTRDIAAIGELLAEQAGKLLQAVGRSKTRSPDASGRQIAALLEKPLLS